MYVAPTAKDAIDGTVGHVKPLRVQHATVDVLEPELRRAAAAASTIASAKSLAITGSSIPRALRLRTQRLRCPLPGVDGRSAVSKNSL